TNFQNDYTRNRIRNELIPFISEKFNPNIIDALCKLSENTAEDSEFLEAYAKRLYNRINSPLPNKKPTVLHIESLEMVGKAIKSRLVIIAARKAMGESYRLEKKHVDEVLKLCKNHTGTRIDLPNGLVVDNKYGWLEFNNMVINVENLENIKENGFYVEVVPNMSYNIKQAECTITFAIKSADYICMINEIMLDYDKVSKKNLAIRNRIDGDKIAFYNDGRRKKVKKCFIDMKIPKEDRGKIPLLCDGKEVLAIIGNRVSTAYKIDNNTKKALVITYGK
ncbi:MAG: tRNA lysidine(34) synthetase TilS, partial [Oscillospiraceae bacterium]